MMIQILNHITDEIKQIRIDVFMKEQGFIDLIVRRQEMRSTIIRLLKMHGKGA